MQSNKQLAAGQRRRIERIENELLEMSEQWVDRDNYLVSVLAEAANEIRKLAPQIQTENEY